MIFFARASISSNREAWPSRSRRLAARVRSLNRSTFLRNELYAPPAKRDDFSYTMPRVRSSAASNSLVYCASMAFGETARHANDFEASIAQVVRLFGVESQNAVGEGLVRRDQDSNLLQAEHLSRGQPVSAVWCPEPAILSAHHDQRV